MSFVASFGNDVFTSIKDVKEFMANYFLLNICYYTIMQCSMNLYLSLLCNELYPADNDIDECFAIGFTENLNMPDN